MCVCLCGCGCEISHLSNNYIVTQMRVKITHWFLQCDHS